jgi:transposase
LETSIVIQITPQMRILVSVESADFRCGIDGLARLCRSALSADPFNGTAFVFRNRRGTGLRVLIYDGQGFWLCYKRLSRGKFHWWPTRGDTPGVPLRAHELAVLFNGGDPGSTRAAPEWRRVTARA